MSLIIKQDKNGVKPLLETGELGYDNYPAGGDSGRVYVGTGSVNIPLAKQAEMSAVDGKADAHIARVDNPHGVTKAQVGLGNADNTADINKIVASAGRLTAGKKINNVVFDNTQDITIKSETPNKVIVKFDGGATEGADIYTFDGSENKSVDIIAGLNVQLVKTPGSVGNSGRLVVAPYDGTSDASLIIGLATESIAPGADGFVTNYGKIRGIDTSMWPDGTVLYVNGGTLATTPTSSLSMKIAAVVTSHTNGTLMVRVNGYSQVKEW